MADKVTPLVDIFGIGFGKTNAKGTLGIDVEGNIDIGAGFRWPWYSESTDLVTNPIFYALIGGRSWISLNLYFIKLHFFLDVIGY